MEQFDLLPFSHEPIWHSIELVKDMGDDAGSSQSWQRLSSC